MGTWHKHRSCTLACLGMVIFTVEDVLLCFRRFGTKIMAQISKIES